VAVVVIGKIKKIHSLQLNNTSFSSVFTIHNLRECCRGFAFVEYLTEDEAKAAMEALANTHFYGRHLVLSYAKENETLADLRQKIQKDYQNLLSQK
jgi:RNA recognition motif-containing protein